jgi:hypothetical protein
MCIIPQHKVPSIFRAIAAGKTIRVFGRVARGIISTDYINLLITLYSVNFFSEAVDYGSFDTIAQLRASPEAQAFVPLISIAPILFKK